MPMLTLTTKTPNSAELAALNIRLEQLCTLQRLTLAVAQEAAARASRLEKYAADHLPGYLAPGGL